MTVAISITIEDELLDYLDEVAAINGRNRSNMISYLIRQMKMQDEALDEEARTYAESNR